MISCGTFAALVLLFCIGKPPTDAARKKFSWLNMPYQGLSKELTSSEQPIPNLIVVGNMRTAGNLKLQFPDVPIVSLDCRHMKTARQTSGLNPENMLIICETHLVKDSMARFAKQTAGIGEDYEVHWKRVDVPYVYGEPEDKRQFHVAMVRAAQSGSLANERVASEKQNIIK